MGLTIFFSTTLTEKERLGRDRRLVGQGQLYIQIQTDAIVKRSQPLSLNGAGGANQYHSQRIVPMNTDTIS